MSELNLFSFADLLKSHVENAAIHGGTGTLVKIGEITPETLNNYEQHEYVKVQYAGVIPEGQYLSKIVFKVFEAFTNSSGEYISDIDLENKPFVNIVNNISMSKLNTNIRDIDIIMNLSGNNQAKWATGNIGVFASFLPNPELLEASRLFSLSLVDEDSNPISGADVFINDEHIGQTNEDGVLIHNVTCEEADLFIQKESYNNIIQDIEPGTANFELDKTMTQAQPESRQFSLMVKNTDQEPIPGAEIFITDISIGTTDNNGLITGDVPTTPFSIGIVKNNLLFEPEIIEAGTEPVEISRELPRTVTAHILDAQQNPLPGVSILIDDVSIGTTDLNGNLATTQISPVATSYKAAKTHFFEIEMPLPLNTSFDISNTFYPCRHLTLTVKDIMDTPIENVLVKIAQVSSGYTNSLGVFEKDITVDQVNIDITKQGYIEYNSNVNAGVIDVELNDVMQNVPATRLLNITVTDNNSMPVQNAALYNGWNSLLGNTDINGHASVTIPDILFFLYIKKSHLKIESEQIDAGTEDIT